MVIEFRDQDVAQKPVTGHASLDRGRGGWFLNNLLAPPATLLQPGNLQHLELGADEVEQFVDVFAQQTQLAASPPAGLEGRRSGPPCRIFGASPLQTGTSIRAVAGIEHVALSRQMKARGSGHVAGPCNTGRNVK
jgi:hypothetical protein